MSCRCQRSAFFGLLYLLAVPSFLKWYKSRASQVALWMTGFILSPVSLILYQQHLPLCTKYTHIQKHHPINQTSQYTWHNSNRLHLYQYSSLLPFFLFKPATRYARWKQADSCVQSLSIVKYISAYRKMNTKYTTAKIKYVEVFFLGYICFL